MYAVRPNARTPFVSLLLKIPQEVPRIASLTPVILVGDSGPGAGSPAYGGLAPLPGPDLRSTKGETKAPPQGRSQGEELHHGYVFGWCCSRSEPEG